MNTENSEKETVIGEVKAPATNEETVEAAKQILADVLTKAVDAIKDSPLSGNTIEEHESKKESAFWRLDRTQTIVDETIVDYVIRCDYEGGTYLVGQGNTFAKSIASAKSFSTEKEALEYINDYQEGEKQIFCSFPFTNAEVVMRTMKLQLNEIGHDE